MIKEPGHKTSERKACYHAFYVGIIISCYGLYKNVDLSGLALLIPAIGSPLMWYAGARSYLKSKSGDIKNDPSN